MLVREVDATRVIVSGPVAWNVTARLEELPAPVAQTVFAQAWTEGIGGTSAGKALTLAGLGAHVTLRTLVGSDDAGQRVLGALAHPSIDVHAMPTADGLTERHVNLIDASGSRVSVYLELPQPVEAEHPLGPGLDGFAAALVDLAAHSVPLLGLLRDAQVPVWCDVHDDDGAGDGYCRPFTAAAHVVIASDAKLADVDGYLAARVAEGAELAVCTRGGLGSVAVHVDEDGEHWFDVGTAEVRDVVDTEGAGDAYTAGLLLALARGATVPVALAEAAAAGAIAVGTKGLGAVHADAATVSRLASTVEVIER